MGAKWFNIIKSEKDEYGVQKLITCDGSTSINSNGVRDISIPINYKRYELKTVRVLNETNTSDIVVKLYDSFDNNEVYRSKEQNNIYDILNIPVEDKKTDDSGNIYLRIENLGNSDIMINYEIKILNLR